jgi:hypothetical protein
MQTNFATSKRWLEELLLDALDKNVVVGASMRCGFEHDIANGKILRREWINTLVLTLADENVWYRIKNLSDDEGAALVLEWRAFRQLQCSR